MEVFDLFQVALCLGDQSDIFFDVVGHEVGFEILIWSPTESAALSTRDSKFEA